MHTAPNLRPPTSYVHGLDGPVVIVPGRAAAWLDSRLNLRALRTAVRGHDPEVDAVLVALGVAAAAWRQSVVGTDQRTPAEPAPLWLTTREAADRLDVTDRAVRRALAEQRLNGRRTNGGWLVDRESVEHYLIARNSRAA